MELIISKKILKNSLEYKSIMDISKLDSIYYVAKMYLNATNENRGGAARDIKK
ncbi:hypothetical protein [Helicobacter sp. MIT 14-3879]|uniref:hypothetical protein n=1 Tax=Helicobacter sp. MIT 14-3879 TaxID=2040649 RepID=UPI0015F19733|nr:hypothetical protein [Helicobacter sp. MIT 14-3879]